MHSLKFSVLIASALVAPFTLLGSNPAAALTTKPASTNPITILGTDYNVFFNEETQSSTTFNNVFGTGSPTLTFTTAADASAAVNAILANIPSTDFEPLGAETSLGFTGFVIPFSFTVTGYSRVGANVLLANGAQTPFGAASFARTSPVFFSYATFEKATAIPTPALLPGLIGMGIAVVRKRKQKGVLQAY